VIFRRFGNAFIATDNGGAIYCVSLYNGAWAPYYLAAGEDNPERIGLYGWGTVEEAKQACRDHLNEPVKLPVTN
jgi:hypothetical protein